MGVSSTPRQWQSECGDLFGTGGGVTPNRYVNEFHLRLTIKKCNLSHYSISVKVFMNHPQLFKSLMATGICTFEVIRRVGQLKVITSVERIKALGNGKDIPSIDTKIGLAARKYLMTDVCHFVLLIDDLEQNRRNQAPLVFNRYRTALDTVLNTLRHRASVHFLVNMLEAYYFADAQAINAVLGTSLSDHGSDVEAIRNPKSDLRQIHPSFDVINDGGRILNQIDIEHVLSRPDVCASLRTLFAWCVKVLERYSDYDCTDFDNKYELHNGKLSEVTRTQLDNL